MSEKGRTYETQSSGADLYLLTWNCFWGSQSLFLFCCAKTIKILYVGLFWVVLGLGRLRLVFGRRGGQT